MPVNRSGHPICNKQKGCERYSGIAGPVLLGSVNTIFETASLPRKGAGNIDGLAGSITLTGC